MRCGPAKVAILWLAVTCVGVVFTYRVTRIRDLPPAPAGFEPWAERALGAAAAGEALPAPPRGAYRGRGTTRVIAWSAGQPVARYAGERDVIATVRAAGAAFARRLGPARPQPAPIYTVSVSEGDGPVLEGVPFLSSLGVVPLREGVEARLGDLHAALTPHELRALGVFEAAVETPIPDLSFGMAWDRVYAHLAEALHVEVEVLRAEASVRRFRARTHVLGEAPGVHGTPAGSGEKAPLRVRLAQAATDGARFLLRHQAADGQLAYRYDARRDRVDNRRYNVVRHAGTAYFLAQASRLLDLPEARRGALAALGWLWRHQLRQCGSAERLCIDGGYGPNVGATALTTLTVAELLLDEGRTGLRSGLARRALRQRLEGLVAFLQHMQRPDGELMHEYDLARDRPIDVQHLYFSGEAALALLRAHRVLGRADVLQAAERLMRHVSGRHWQFFGSRYYFGEEHWTCMAVGEAADRLPVAEGITFCDRWSRFNARVQYDQESPWPIAGAYGVGPLLLPLSTPAATRSEAFISLYPLLEDARRAREVRGQIEGALEFLLRTRFAPGPAPLLADPRAAWGGVPRSAASFEVRNDFVQHACSAMARWSHQLGQEGGN